MVHMVLADCDCDREICTMPHRQISEVTASAAVTAMKRGLQNRGVDIMGRDAFLVSGAHAESDIDQTIEAFRETMAAVRAEGLI
jgi:glutamate-1-semialdehyde aminotransferase